MKKLKAFTIIELVMSLLISSIVIGIVYYAFLFFNKQFIGYNNKSHFTSEYLLAGTALKTDMERAEAIRDSLADFIVIKGPMACEEVVYEVARKTIVRRCGETIDSFQVENNGMQAVYVSDSVNLVRQIIFEFVINNNPMKTVFSKQYTASQLMEGEKTSYE